MDSDDLWASVLGKRVADQALVPVSGQGEVQAATARGVPISGQGAALAVLKTQALSKRGKHHFQLPGLPVGFQGRHGGEADRKLLSHHMHLGKASATLARTLRRQANSLEALMQELWAKLGFRVLALDDKKGGALQQARGRKKELKILGEFRDLGLKLLCAASGRGMSHHGALSIAYSPPMAVSALARMYNVSYAVICYKCICVATCYLHWQLQLLGSLCKAFQANPPLHFTTLYKFDETSEKLGFKGTGNTTLNVMVIRVNLRWTWSITADNEVVRCFSLPLVVPPVVVLGTSAAQLWHGLWYHPLTRPIMSAIAILASLSKRSMSVVVTDDAAANAKLDSFWRQLCEQAGEFHCRLPCMMHQLHLASVSVVQGTDHGKSLVNTLYSASLLLRMGGNFFRLHHSTTSVVASATKTIGEPPRDAIEFAAELLDYVAVNYRSVSSRAREAGRSTEDAFTQDRMDPEADPEVEEGESGTRAGHRASLGQLWRTRLMRSESLPQLLEMWGLPDRSAKAQMLKDVVQCMEIFNGPLFPCGCNSHWHYCTGAHCCPHGPAGVQSMKDKMANSLKAVILRVVPTVPAVSRWTAVGPAVDFFVLGYLFRQILGPLCQSAFESFVSEGTTISGETTEADWHKVRGNRSKRFLAYLGDKEALRSTLVLSVALEPLRFFVQWLLKSARETPSQDDPALVSLAYAPTSPVHAMLQYIGAVLAGQSSRLVLVYRSGGFASYLAWCAGSASEVRELRRLLLP